MRRHVSFRLERARACQPEEFPQISRQICHEAFRGRGSPARIGRPVPRFDSTPFRTRRPPPSPEIAKVANIRRCKFNASRFIPGVTLLLLPPSTPPSSRRATYVSALSTVRSVPFSISRFPTAPSFSLPLSLSLSLARSLCLPLHHRTSGRERVER